MTAHSQVLGHSACILNLCAQLKEEDVINSDKNEVVQTFYKSISLLGLWGVSAYRLLWRKNNILLAAETGFAF